MGRGGHRGRHPPPQLPGPSDAPDQLPSARILPCTWEGGPLSWFLPRWYYDPTERICKSFVYGGCLGNKNNYLREEECKLACHNVQGGPLRSSVGAQVTFPRVGVLSSRDQGGGHGNTPIPRPPISSSWLGPGPASSHFSVFLSRSLSKKASSR